MNGISVHVSIDSAAFALALNQLVAAGADLSAPFAEVGEYLVSETTERFRSGRSPEGTPWKKVQRGGSPLVDKGHLRDSVTYDADADGVRVGTNRVYARIHHFGGEAGRKNNRVNIDARPFLGVNQQDMDEIGNIFSDHLARSFSA